MNTVWMWPATMMVMMTPTRTEILTGTTTASPLGVVVAAGEAGTETEGTDAAILGTGPPRYGKLLLPPSISPD